MKTEIWTILKKEWIIILTYFLMGIVFGQRCHAQLWQDENRGLYPQSFQLNYNAKNTALGFRYGYLFQKPVFGMPMGIYTTFSNTIYPQWNNNVGGNNYDWERKYSIGLSITLPQNNEAQPRTHFMGTLGAVYNQHPRANQDEGLLPGISEGGYKHTSNYGLDIGIMMQHGRLATHLKADVFNWMSYVEVGAGYTFFRIRK